MLSSYRIHPNTIKKRSKNVSSTKFNNNSHREHDLKRPQTASNDLAKHQTSTQYNRRNKNILKTGTLHENIENNDQYLYEFWNNNDIQTDLAMQIIFKDKTVRSDTIQDLKEFNSQSLSSQAKKGRTVDFNDACYQKSF